MERLTQDLWAKQDQHAGDRHRLFSAVSASAPAASVLYPGSFVDIAPSFCWPSVTYVDNDRRAARFFADIEGVAEILADHGVANDADSVTFVAGDYTAELELGMFDLLISLYAGFVSESCTQHLRVGGTLLVNSSHGDAAMASIDDRYQLSGVVERHRAGYVVSANDLDRYLVPKVALEVTVEHLHRTGRGVAYTRTPFAYLFRRVR